MAPRVAVRDRANGAKFCATGARSISREISFTIRAHTQKFFGALVLIAK
jgi:hypothetical protein